MTDEQQSAALREEIRREVCRAGRSHRNLGKTVLAWSVACAAGAALIDRADTLCQFYWTQSGKLEMYGPGWGFVLLRRSPDISNFLFWGLVGFVIVTIAFPVLRRRQLRRRLAALSADDVQALCAAVPATDLASRRILAPLLRERGVRSEVSPAARPCVRGDEPSPAEPRS